MTAQVPISFTFSDNALASNSTQTCNLLVPSGQKSSIRQSISNANNSKISLATNARSSCTSDSDQWETIQNELCCRGILNQSQCESLGNISFSC